MTAAALFQPLAQAMPDGPDGPRPAVQRARRRIDDAIFDAIELLYTAHGTRPAL